MNARFNKNSAAEVAQMIGVTACTVQDWCRNGKINCFNVSGGDKYGRYEIDDDEANYICKLSKKYGKRNVLRNYDKNWKDSSKKRVNKVEEIKDIPWTLDLDTEEIEVPRKRLDEDKILNTIIYIREIKERIKDCEAELNQLRNEYRQLKKEINEQI